MAEYIDKERLLNAIECIDISDCTDIDDIFIEVERTVDDQPTADVAEVKHGEWIPCGDGEHTPLMCSSCLNTWGFYKKRGSNYCPRCGAKMDWSDFE